MKHIIGLAGYSGAGKDTAALILNRMLPRYACTSFAQPLKSALSSLFLFSHDQLNTELREVKDDRWPMTPRETMQFLGTDVLRDQVDEDIFIKNLAERMRDDPYVLITDVRFENEARWIQSQGGLVWLITDDSPPTSNHVSEQLPNSLFPFDNYIRNVGDIAMFTQALSVAVDQHDLEERINRH